MTDTPTLTLDRRDFLALGAAAALPVGAAWTQSAILSAPTSLAIGHACDSQVIDARSRPCGDARFTETGARVTVHGVFPHGDPCDCTALHAVSLDVDHRPFHEATFQAWSFRRADVLSVSRTVAFTVPIGADSGLPLVVRTQETPSSSPSVFPLRLSPGREPGLARLVCGHFAIALPGERPVWENCELRALLADDERGESTGGPRTLCRRGEAAEVPVPFGYFLITVEHAGA